MLNSIAKLKSRNRLIFDLSIILLISILVVLPIYFNGIPELMDTPQQFQFAQVFYDSIVNGNLYPSWAADPNYGYGDVSVRFYPPLAYYFLAFFRAVAGNWYEGSCFFFIFLYFLSGVGVYLWSREWFSENSSLIGAVVYVLLPYHIMQIYIGALFAEFTAAAVLPFCFLFITRISQKGRLIDILGLAITFGLLIISHLPTTIMASLTFALYALFSLRKTDYIQTILKLIAAVGFGLFLSSFYWVRMATELNFVKHNSEAFSSGFYSYKSQLVFSYLFPFYDVKSAPPTALMNLIATLTLGILVIHIIFYFKKTQNEKNSSIKNLLIATFFALLMSTPLSIPVWEAVPVLQKIQFPFRWLILFSVGTAVFVSAGVDLVIQYFKTPKRYLSFIAIGFLIICLPYNYFGMMDSFVTYPKDYLTKVIGGFKKMPSYECWWTTWTEKSTSETAKNSLPRPELLTAKLVLNDRPFTVDSWSANQRILTLQAGQAGQADFATLYYPHWKVSVNEKPVEVIPSPTGMISFPVTAEESKIRIYFQEPAMVISSYYLSAFAWFIYFILLSFCFFKFPENKQNQR